MQILATIYTIIIYIMHFFYVSRLHNNLADRGINFSFASLKMNENCVIGGFSCIFIPLSCKLSRYLWRSSLYRKHIKNTYSSSTTQVLQWKQTLSGTGKLSYWPVSTRTGAIPYRNLDKALRYALGIKHFTYVSAL